MSDLIERLRAATGPDRELDLEFGKAVLGWYLYEHKAYGDYDTDWAEWRWPDGKQVFVFGAITAFTASIDAALALVERKLPGTLWATGSMEEGPFCRLVTPHGDGWKYYQDNAATAPLAILLALLTALEHPHDE